MSKLLTDLMEAERKRRQRATDCGAEDASAGASGQGAADLAVAALARTGADAAFAGEARRRAEVESGIEAGQKTAETASRKAREAAEPATAAAVGIALEKEAEAVAATANHQNMATVLAASRFAVPRPEAAAGPASAKHGPRAAWWRLFAAAALALTAGIGIGVWLGKPPAVPVRPWSDDQGALRLRYDDRLTNPPEQESRTIQRDRPQ